MLVIGASRGICAAVAEAFGREGTHVVLCARDTDALEATATPFHGDYWWESTYYVDERVVRRTEDEGVDPRDGELLECRRSG